MQEAASTLEEAASMQALALEEAASMQEAAASTLAALDGEAPSRAAAARSYSPAEKPMILQPEVQCCHSYFHSHSQHRCCWYCCRARGARLRVKCC
jgi:hypothetical protein